MRQRKKVNGRPAKEKRVLQTPDSVSIRRGRSAGRGEPKKKKEKGTPPRSSGRKKKGET